MAEEGIRLVLCMGVDCNDSGRARPLRKMLESWLAEHAGRNVKLEFASCLTHCARGPNLMRYPGGTVNHRLDPVKLEALLNSLRQ
ncbi:MAG: (2Fe-2S) ferredoxin domain-containing protein [Anaerolineaceae bacterium]|nr:(2Fe-2S) ferredoxin domain-containing protein [Anaerolineaceae bacterium]